MDYHLLQQVFQEMLSQTFSSVSLLRSLATYSVFLLWTPGVGDPSCPSARQCQALLAYSVGYYRGKLTLAYRGYRFSCLSLGNLERLRPSPLCMSTLQRCSQQLFVTR